MKRKIDQESDTSFHQLRSDELEEMAKEFLENGGFRVYSEPFNASEGKKQPDALAVSDDRLIVVEYTTTGDLLHERKMESFLNMKDILADISGGKKVEFWLLTNRMSEPKVSNLEAKGIKVLMTMPRGKWPDSSFDLE